MKLIDALKNVIKTQENSEHPNFDEFCELAGVNSYDVTYDTFVERLKAYWLKCWLCTDTWVGMQAIYLDDVLVAYTEQTARKNCYHISFIDKDSADKVIDFIRSLADASYNYNIATDELNSDIDLMCVEIYGNNLLDKHGFVKGKSVTIKNSFRSDDPKSYYCHDMFNFVYDDTGESGTCSVAEYTFPLRVNNG